MPKKLLLDESQANILQNGGVVTIQRPVDIPKTVMKQVQLLQKYPVQNRSQLSGFCGEELIPLIVGMVRLNVEKSCIEFDVYDQQQVIL